MTREEAIAILQEEIDGNLELTLSEWIERDEQRLFPAMRVAIEALTEPSIVRCEDCKHHGMRACPVWEDYITEDYMWCYHGERREDDQMR